MKNRFSLAIGSIALVAMSVTARASVMTFTSPAGLFAGNSSIVQPHINNPALPVYGDRINNTFAVSTAYTYGNAYGSTPNVTVLYGPGNQALASGGANPVPVYWQSVTPYFFGDLVGVIYQVNVSASKTLSVTLTADPGYSVWLESFDLAGLTGFAYALDSVKVIVDGAPTTIATSPITISTTTHTSFNFTGSPFTGNSIQILLDGTVSNSNNFGNIAIDNIAFSQPEPAMIGPLGIGILGLLRRRQSRREA